MAAAALGPNTAGLADGVTAAQRTGHAAHLASIWGVSIRTKTESAGGWSASQIDYRVLAYGALTRFTLGRVDGPIRDALKADAGGDLDGECLRRGFAAAVRFPVHGVYSSLATWVGAAVVLPALMMVRYPDFPVTASVAISIFRILPPAQKTTAALSGVQSIFG